MASLARFLALTAISICADLGLAQNANLSTGQKKVTKQSETAVKKNDEEKRLNRPALIFVKADRERIYALLAEQMKQREFTLTQKDANKIVFSKRTPGAEAATRRKQFDRSVTTPIIDDPRTILAFILIEKNSGYVVAGRMIVTTILNSQVFSFDVSERKEARINLNKTLEKLKSDADTPQATP
jgi:hypothetical protein